MKKNRIMGPVNLLLLVAAVGLLMFSGIGGARAALNYVSETMALRVATGEMTVELWENGKQVPDGTLLTGLEETIQPGKAYEESLTVHNSGGLDEYVRLTVFRCWTVGGGPADHPQPGVHRAGHPRTGLGGGRHRLHAGAWGVLLHPASCPGGDHRAPV